MWWRREDSMNLLMRGMMLRLWLISFLGILAHEILRQQVQCDGVQRENVQGMLVLDTVEFQSRRSPAGYDYTRYHPMDEIYQWMDDLERMYTQLVTQHNLGMTYETRPMNYLKISKPSDSAKKIIWMDCGIHAREWISPAFCQWFVKEIVQNHQHDPKIKILLQNVDVYVLPVYNVDGYLYSWTTDRLWRKSTAPQHKGKCFGTDLNRNFDVMWGSVDVAPNCTSEEFCGTKPASEPETKAMVNFVKSKKSEIICYLTIHSFGQVILIPYGYSGKLSRNYKVMMDIAVKAAAALKQQHGTEYKVGPFYSTLYPATGTSQDWVYDQGVEFAFTIELRDKGKYGFQLPEDQIQPTCEEAVAAVMTIMESVAEKKFPSTEPMTTSST